jgi:CheY-like chemotaxis protein
MKRSGNVKVLLVDDSDVVLMTEKLMFRNMGNFELLFAKNGREAVKLAHAEQPDLILMDIIMPEMNGLEACRAIRSDERTQGIPIIMVTTKSEESTVSEGYEVGCNDYVTKPIDKNELVRKMEDLLASEGVNP